MLSVYLGGSTDRTYVIAQAIEIALAQDRETSRRPSAPALEGDDAWVLRDSTGQPLWRSVETTPRGCWTKKRVLVPVVAITAVALVTVLRH